MKISQIVLFSLLSLVSVSVAMADQGPAPVAPAPKGTLCIGAAKTEEFVSLFINEESNKFEQPATLFVKSWGQPRRMTCTIGDRIPNPTAEVNCAEDRADNKSFINIAIRPVKAVSGAAANVAVVYVGTEDLFPGNYQPFASLLCQSNR